jgi:hypothetical protein
MIVTNKFHRTEYRTRKTREELDRIADRIAAGHATPAEKRLERKIWRTLCGMSDCKCSGYFGIR